MSDADGPQDEGEQARGHSDAGDVGSLAEEAAKLAAAFASWAVDGGARAGQHVHDIGVGVAEGVQGAVNELDEHLATGSQECTTCPLCRAVSAVREVSPEVKQHLGAAATSLVAAASGFMAAFNAAGRASDAPSKTAGDSGVDRPPGTQSAQPASDIERIDLEE